MIKPELCNRLSTTAVTHFKSVATLCLSSHHSGAMLSKSNFLIYCDLRLHHDFYCINRVKLKKVRTKKGTNLSYKTTYERYFG